VEAYIQDPICSAFSSSKNSIILTETLGAKGHIAVNCRKRVLLKY